MLWTSSLPPMHPPTQWPGVGKVVGCLCPLKTLFVSSQIRRQWWEKEEKLTCPYLYQKLGLTTVIGNMCFTGPALTLHTAHVTVAQHSPPPFLPCLSPIPSCFFFFFFFCYCHISPHWGCRGTVLVRAPPPEAHLPTFTRAAT